MSASTRLHSSDRPIQRRARGTREKIEAAALSAFAQSGFEGASTGEIARRAGVTQQLVIYHYETKLALWQAVADRLFTAARERSAVELEGLDALDPATRVRQLVREFVRFSAETPELARFIIQEGDVRGPRLEWLVERHIRPYFERVVGALEHAQRQGVVTSGDPAHLFFLVLGSAAMLAQPAQAEMLTGRDLLDSKQVDAYADLVARAVLSDPDSSQPEERSP